MLTNHPLLVPKLKSRSYTSSPQNASMAVSGTALSLRDVITARVGRDIGINMGR
jgi:hypothetical protein